MNCRALYIGHSDPGTTSFHRFAALRRIGVEVELIDPYKAFAGSLTNPVLEHVHYRTGYRLIQHGMIQWLNRMLNSRRAPDLIWVDSGELIGPSCVLRLRALGVPIILYNVDDPTGESNIRRFASLLKAASLYDLCVVVRDATRKELQGYGAKKVLKVWRSYDEVAHAPFAVRTEIPSRFRSEVAFIGTWMQEERREQFLMEVIARGVDISIWGDRWKKSRLWDRFKKHWRGPGLSGREYVAAIQGAKICLGLLAKKNRDLHTQRSLEIPYAGGLLCAERTIEHAELFREGAEAVFWSDAEECAHICQLLLSDPLRRDMITSAGERRVRSLKVGNEDIVREIISEFDLGCPPGRRPAPTESF